MMRFHLKQTLATLAGILCFGLTAVSAHSQVLEDLVLEDFEHGNKALFTQATPPGQMPADNLSLVPGAAHDGALGARFTQLTLGSPAWYYRTDYSTQPGDTIFGYVRFETVGGTITSGRTYIGVGATAAGTLSMVAATNTNQILLGVNPGYGFLNLAASPFTFTGNTWYRQELVYGSGTATVNLYDENRATLLATTGPVPITFSQVGGLAFRGFSENPGSVNIDTVGILIPEPGTLALFGTGTLTLLGCGWRRRRRAA